MAHVNGRQPGAWTAAWLPKVPPRPQETCELRAECFGCSTWDVSLCWLENLVGFWAEMWRVLRNKKKHHHVEFSWYMHRIEGKDMIWLCLSWWIYSPSMSIWMVKWRSTMRFWGRLSSDKAMVLCSQELNHKYHWPLKKSWLSDYLHVTGWLQQGPGFATATRLQLHTTYFNHAFPRRHRSRDGAEGNLGALCGEAVFQREAGAMTVTLCWRLWVCSWQRVLPEVWWII